ncbi:MAG: hypothetical protein ACYTGJ_13625 [Planctomycetota bacterium]
MTRPESRTSAVCGSRTVPPSGPRAFPLLSLTVTGWYTELATIPAGFAGKRVRPEFHATDVGDSAWDTAVLIDHIEVLPIQN